MVVLNMTINVALNTTIPVTLNTTNNVALNFTNNVAWNATANDVLSNEKGLLPPFLIKYFHEKPPAGNFKWDTEWYTVLRLTTQGFINTTIWGLPITSCYFRKFEDFVTTGDWNSKHLKDIPGIGEVYAARMKKSLRNYCSVPQLFDMYLYWLNKGEPRFFFDLLYWAAGAYNNNGRMHIERAFQAFRQKHLLSLPPVVPWNVVDPFPYLPEIEYEDISRSG